MRKAALAGMVMLATVGCLSISGEGVGVPRAAAEEIAVTEGHIARLKSALKLTAAQEHHWRPVEAALRALAARARGREEVREGGGGTFQLVRERVVDSVRHVGLLRRLSATAQPLIASLDDGQKQDGLAAIRAMGFTSLP